MDAPGKSNRDAENAEPLWRKYREQTIERFEEMCCYTAVWVPNGDADHFVAWARVRGTPQAHLAYQWANIRYADGWINKSKGSAIFPDPFVVQDDWFELRLPSLELHATGKHPPAEHDAIQNLLKRVQKGTNVMRTRRKYFRMYQEGKHTIEAVDELAPLLGRALRANPKFLTAADFARHQAGTL